MPQTARLLLAEPQQEDFDAYFAIYSDPQTNLFNPSGPMTAGRAVKAYQNILHHWYQHKFGLWVIKEKYLKTTIGFGGLTYLNYGGKLRLNLGYRFAKDSWGRGYATELSDFAIKYGCEDLKTEEIFALVRPAHTASIRVLEKCGMHLYGSLDDVPGKEPSIVYCLQRPNPEPDAI